MFNKLRNEVCHANRGLWENGLVILGEGNASAITGDRKYIVIKPSGIECGKVNKDILVVVDTKGNKVEGKLNPSVDTLIHLEIYLNFPRVGSIVHTHSLYATIFAQKNEPIPCLGTTHADAFCGSVPVAREMTDEEIKGEYERNTGKVICEVLDENIPAVLVPYHGVFAFGKSAEEALNNAVILEKVAKMAIYTGSKQPINPVLMEKHFSRKHGSDRYYGQGI